MSTAKIQIRPLTQWEEITALAEQQAAIWATGRRSLLSSEAMAIAVNEGGLVLGAFEGDRLIGGAVAMSGVASVGEEQPDDVQHKLIVDQVGVLPEYRNRGIGSHLMLAFYQFALRRGIRLITWLYDPLEGPFAHIAVRKLGAVVNDYLPDVFPDVSVEDGGNSDQFHVAWWLNSGRSIERLKKDGRTPLTLDQYLDAGVRILNPTTVDSRSLPVPSEDFIRLQSALGLIEIPEHLETLLEADTSLVEDWQAHTRAIFASVLSEGFVLTDFIREVHEGRTRSFYVCSHEETLRGFEKNFNSN